MKHSVMKEENFPAVMLTQVLRENPRAPKSQVVINALLNREHHLPQPFMEQIFALDTVLSEQEILMSNLGALKAEKQNAIKQMSRNIALDTLNISNDSLIYLLQIAEDLESDYQLIDLYLKNQNTQQAAELFGQLPDKYELTYLEQSEYEKMSEIINLQINLINEARTINDLSESEKQTLYQLSEDDFTKAGGIARNILSIADSLEIDYLVFYPEIVPMPEYSTGSGIFEITFDVSPNPANDYFVADYNLGTKNFFNSEFRMYDFNNQLVLSQNLEYPEYQILIETENIEAGIYLCKLYKDNEEISSKSILIKSENLSNLTDFQNLSGLQIYPNPAKDFVTLCTNEIQNSTIEIYNSIGQKVYQTEVKSSQTEISTNDFVSGVYIIQLKNGYEIINTVKLIIEK